MTRATAAVLTLWFLAIPVAADEFRSQWPSGVERSWIGPEYFANRLQDWRVADGRVECIEGRRAWPLRTLQLLTARLEGAGDATLSVTTRPIVREKASPDTWSGFLIGCGGGNVDYRLSALVHHTPGESGGLLAVVDGQGRVAFRDNSGKGKSGSWAVRGPIDPKLVPVLEPTTSTRLAEIPNENESRVVALELAISRAENGYTLRLSARDRASGKLLSEATLEGVEASRVDGAVALVSHLGYGGKGHGFLDWRVSGSKVRAYPDRAFGPVLCAQHTVSGGVLKMTAQMGPLGVKDARTASLEIERDGTWRRVAEATLDEDSETFRFRVESWDSSRDAAYRIVYDLKVGDDGPRRTEFAGTIRAEPRNADEFVVAAFTGHKIYTGGLKWNHGGLWFPHVELVAAVSQHDPDFLFFSGDQIYEGDLTPPILRPEGDAILDYLNRWYRWCWAFRELTRNVPSVCIPDDHDVYHGNIWGAGGRRGVRRDGMTAQDAGGYKMSERFVNMVHRTQTSHLPDAVEPTSEGTGITSYYTRVEYAGMSFAVIADRQWKSSPTVKLPHAQVVNGWAKSPDYDPVTQGDPADAVLLGEGQLRFLREWATDYSHGAWQKIVLSQTIFANVATLPPPANTDAGTPRLPNLAPDDYPEGDVRVADHDSNGWPASGRNRALREMRRGFAFHIAGDQHLGSTIQYGIDEWHDAGFALCVPSVANTWPRRWFPSEEGGNPRPGLRYSGDYRDGFGNLMTVHAVSNPVVAGVEPARLYNRAPGYGIARFRRKSREIQIECWPRWVDPSAAGAKPYRGWPVTIRQSDNYGRERTEILPVIRVEGIDEPVVRVIDERNGIPVYARRMPGQAFQLGVFRDGSYRVEVGDPDIEMKVFDGVTPISDPNAVDRLNVQIGGGR